MPFDELVAVYAPTLPQQLIVSIDGKRSEFAVGWLSRLPPDKFENWVWKAIQVLEKRDLRSSVTPERHDLHWKFMREQPTVSWPCGTPQFVDGNTRLIASFVDQSVLCLRGLAAQAIHTPGFFGIVELETAGLEVSRSRAVRADLSSILDAARKAVTPQIIENLNSMGSQALLINKTRFFAQCVSVYGKDVILQSRLPWVSQLKFPGNVELVDSTTLISRLTTARSAFMSFNTGPWTAMKEWEAANPLPTEIAMVLDGEGELGLRYLSSPEIGTIADLWENWSQAPLFSTLIDIVAQAWQITPSDLVRQDGWTHSTSHLTGRFSRA